MPETQNPRCHNNIISNIINVAAGFILINGFWFVPGMGIKGAAIAGVLLVRVPLAILLIVILHFGVGAAWIAATIDQYIRSSVVYFRFKNGRWKLVKM